MSKIREVDADPVLLWCYGIAKWRIDRDHYRIIPGHAGRHRRPPAELGREMWEELERMADRDRSDGGRID
jgi:hypothetical protein